MSGKLIEKYATRATSAGGELDAATEPDGAEDFGACGILRGMRERAVMLELRRESGDIVAIPYAFIERIEFNPSEGITLRCGRDTVRLKGRNLNGEIRPQVRLYQQLTRQRVSWIAEAGQGNALQLPKDAVVVEAIEW